MGERLAIKFDGTLGRTETAAIIAEQEHDMRKVIRGYAKDKNLNLSLIGTIPVPYCKDSLSGDRSAPSPAKFRPRRP